MDINKTLERINKDRDHVEAAFVFSLWKDPSLYEDYKSVNEGKDQTLQHEDSKFYFSLGRELWNAGYKTFDNITLSSFLADKKELNEQFESRGGWKECESLMSLVNPDNAAAYFDKIAKTNSLSIICKKYNEVFEDVSKFDKYSNEDVYNMFDLLNNQVSLTTGHDAKIESLVVDDDYIRRCNSGEEVGMSYSKGAPLLNWLTLGIPKGDITLFAAHSGQGKSSFIFENILLPVSQDGHKVAIISNEMQSKAYKNLLLAHVLTRDLNYWKITRKKLKSGHFNEEEMEMMKRAAQITKEKYSNIVFIKMFENNTSKVLKYVKRLARSGVEMFFYDTMKSDDEADSEIWQKLLLDSRKIFNVVSHENVAFIATFQLALHTTNQRFLDAGCLSNSKQVKEVVSELIMMRKLWDDEYTGKRYDCHPWKRDKENPKIKHPITLDPERTYLVAFLNKTRNDEDGQTILYEWNGTFNRWWELGYCTIVNEHKTYN